MCPLNADSVLDAPAVCTTGPPPPLIAGGVLRYHDGMLWSASRLSLPIVLLLFAACGRVAAARTWTDSSGQYRVEATFVKAAGETVQLRKEDGTLIEVPLWRLCPADQELIKQLDTQQVLAEGCGRTLEEALNEALRRAVQSVVGTLMDSQMLVRNDKLIEERILTFSEGFVSTYKEIGTPQTKNGLIYRTILATVRRREVLEGLSATNAPIAGEGLYAEAYTRLQRLQSGLLMIRKELEKFPAGVLRHEFTYRQEGVKAGANTSRISHQVVVTVDEDKYAKVRRRLIDILEPLARISARIETLCEPVRKKDRDAALERMQHHFLTGVDAEGPLRPEFSTIEELQQTAIEGVSEDTLRDYQPQDTPTRVTLNQDPGCPHGTATWRVFEIENAPRIPTGAIILTVAYRDQDDRPVYQEEVPLGPALPGLSIGSQEWSGRRLNTVILSPFFVRHEQAGPKRLTLYLARSLTLRGGTTFTLSQLARIKRIDVRVTMDSWQRLTDRGGPPSPATKDAYAPTPWRPRVPPTGPRSP